jgi:Family of unknown function (DUF5683)
VIRSLYILLFVFLLGSSSSFAQTELGEGLRVKDTIKKSSEINVLAPSKAAFYSAVFPGMGQVYNKKYWKLPLVYGALGTTIYFYISNNKKYHLYRDAYKQRLEGLPDDYTYLDNSRLISAQKFYQKNRDLSALLTGLFYILNIVDANVDAHLMQFNVNDKLTVKPDLYRNEFTTRENLGICLTLKL